MGGVGWGKKGDEDRDVYDVRRWEGVDGEVGMGAWSISISTSMWRLGWVGGVCAYKTEDHIVIDVGMGNKDKRAEDISHRKSRRACRCLGRWIFMYIPASYYPQWIWSPQAKPSTSLAFAVT